MGKLRRSPTASQKRRSSLMTLLPSPDLMPRLGSTIHICRILPSYILPLDLPLPGLPSQEMPAEEDRRRSPSYCCQQYPEAGMQSDLRDPGTNRVLYPCCRFQQAVPKSFSMNQPETAVLWAWRGQEGPQEVCWDLQSLPALPTINTKQDSLLPLSVQRSFTLYQGLRSTSSWERQDWTQMPNSLRAKSEGRQELKEHRVRI